MSSHISKNNKKCSNNIKYLELLFYFIYFNKTFSKIELFQIYFLNKMFESI